MAGFAISMFGGEDPLPWIEKVEYIWCEFQLSDAELIDLVFPCLVGKAKSWIEANMNLISEKNWCSLMYNILWEFTKSSAKDTEPLAHDLGEVQIVSIPRTEFSKEFDLFASSNVESVKPTDGEENISIQGEKKSASLDKDEVSDCSKDIIEILALSRFEEIPLAIPSPSVDNDIASWVREDAAYVTSNLLQEKGNSSRDGVNVVSPVTMSTMGEACLNFYTVGVVIQEENMLSSIKAPYYSVSKGARFLANATQYKAGSAMQHTTFIWEPGSFLLLLDICNYMGEETEAIKCSMNKTVLVVAPQPDAKKVFDCIELAYVVAVFILVCKMFIFSEGVFIRNDKSAGCSSRCSLLLDILYHSFDCQQPVLQCQVEVHVIWQGRTGPQPWDTILVWNNDCATKSLETCTELNAPHPVNFSLKNLLRLLLYGLDNSTPKLEDTMDGIVRGDNVTNLYLSFVYKLPDQAPNGVIYKWCFDPGPAGVRFIDLPLLLLPFAMSFHITKSDFDIADLHLTLVQSREAHNFQSMPHYFKFLMARYYVSFDPGIDCSISYGLRADWWCTALRRELTVEFATTPRAAKAQHIFGYAKLSDCGTDLCINTFVCFQSASIVNHLIAMHMDFSRVKTT